jgi:hypothetical protein
MWQRSLQTGNPKAGLHHCRALQTKRFNQPNFAMKKRERDAVRIRKVVRWCLFCLIPQRVWWIRFRVLAGLLSRDPSGVCQLILPQRDLPGKAQ